MIKLTNFLVFSGIPLNLESYKIHLATGEKHPPIDAYYKGEFKKWQEYQTRHNFTRQMVIGLIELSSNKWLFAGVYKVLSHSKISEKHVDYLTELLPNQADLIGRIIVYHERQGRASYLIGEKDGGNFYISELKDKKLAVEKFPGYNYVNISYEKLKIIFSQNVESWSGALANIKGIYLISDSQNGKHYVGSAKGNEGIWQRWADYAKNGHGGNSELKKVLNSHKSGYENNFNFSILEIADTQTSDDDILRREIHWKNVLLTRRFGYNSN